MSCWTTLNHDVKNYIIFNIILICISIVKFSSSLAIILTNLNYPSSMWIIAMACTMLTDVIYILSCFYSIWYAIYKNKFFMYTCYDMYGKTAYILYIPPMSFLLAGCIVFAIDMKNPSDMPISILSIYIINFVICGCVICCLFINMIWGCILECMDTINKTKQAIKERENNIA